MEAEVGFLYSTVTVVLSRIVSNNRGEKNEGQTAPRKFVFNDILGSLIESTPNGSQES